MTTLHVKSFLNSIDFISKFFLLSPNSGNYKGKIKSWRSLTLSNCWILTGFISYFYFHLMYVMKNDNAGQERVKLVTLFIDNYNKYSGLLLVTILVLVGYFQQAKTEQINRIFNDIERIYLKQLVVTIHNVNTLR